MTEPSGEQSRVPLEVLEPPEFSGYGPEHPRYPSHRQLVEAGEVYRTSLIDLATCQKLFGADFARDPSLILDLGAGDATWATEVRESPDHAARVVRADLGYFYEPPEDPVDVIPADALDLPFRDNTFDALVSCNMLSHMRFRDGEQMLAEALRVTKPSGELSFFPVVDSLRFTSPRKHRPVSIIKPGEVADNELQRLAWWGARMLCRHPLPHRVFKTLRRAHINSAGTNRI